MKKRIIVNNVFKKFRIGFMNNKSTLKSLLCFFSGKEQKKDLVVLKSVSLYAREGEIVGVIGKNGSGKSTLLRCIAGIYDYKGEIKVFGKLISLINLNVGLQLRLTMKDNVYLCCSLFGLCRQEINQKFNEIVEFSELKEFINTKIYQFSEGMKQRLAFSIAINCNPDVLLLDEVFEVGDEEFKLKSAGKIKDLAKSGGTVVLVSHDLEMVRKYCDRVVLMDKGKIIKEGNAKKVLREYQCEQRFLK